MQLIVKLQIDIIRYTRAQNILYRIPKSRARIITKLVKCALKISITFFQLKKKRKQISMFFVYILYIHIYMCLENVTKNCN